MGVILFELLTGIPPFMGKNREELKKRIDKGFYKIPPGVEISDVALNLIESLLIQDVEKRMNWE